MVTRRTFAVCALALVGFAANSLLARQALGAGLADPATYTLVRLGAGTALLVPLARAMGATRRPDAGSWAAGAALAAYAAAFSFAYVRIGAALGALVLFPTVKLSLFAWGVARGERPPRQELAGATLAFAGLVLLTLPGTDKADPPGILLMILAGIAWAVYTLAGRSTQDPTAATAANFARAALIAAPLAWPAVRAGQATESGVVLAVVSGAFASGLAYSLWYVAVPNMTATQAGLAQLAVPGLATLGAVALLGEPITVRLVAAGATIFGGVALALVRR